MEKRDLVLAGFISLTFVILLSSVIKAESLEGCNKFNEIDCANTDNWDENVIENILEHHSLDEDSAAKLLNEAGCSPKKQFLIGCKWAATICVEFVEDKCSAESLVCETQLTEITGNCETDEKQYIEWTVSGTAVGQNWCKSGKKNFPCSSKSAIPFFTLANLIVSCLAVCIVYFAYHRKKVR
ncbi:MAG: hypothetical protein WC533_01030 [Candidatus Pacearchaeota archaeon]